MLYDRSLNLAFLSTDQGYIDQITPALDKLYPETFKPIRVGLGELHKWKKMPLTEQFLTEFIENGTVEQGNEVWNGSGVPRLDWEQLLSDVNIRRMETIMKIVNKQKARVPLHKLYKNIRINCICFSSQKNFRVGEFCLKKTYELLENVKIYRIGFANITLFF